MGPDVDSIFEVLRARFRVTTGNVRVQLQRLRRYSKTPLIEDATIVEQLAA